MRSGLAGLAGDASAAGQVTPWFATDEEGGTVARLSNVLGPLPSARQMTAQSTPAQVEAEMTSHGRAMRALGMTMDLAPVLDSVHRTGRILIAHEAVVPFGIGAEIAATVAREAFWDLDAPVQRLGAAATPPPYAPELERAWLPDRDAIGAALRHLAAV